jgi:hypothetical protein
MTIFVLFLLLTQGKTTPYTKIDQRFSLPRLIYYFEEEGTDLQAFDGSEDALNENG